MKPEEEYPLCPNCGSDDVIKHKLSRKIAVFTWLFMGFPFPFSSSEYHCFDCGSDFKV